MPRSSSTPGAPGEGEPAVILRAVTASEVRVHLATLRGVRDLEDFKFELHATPRVDALISLLLDSDLPDDASEGSITLPALRPGEAAASVIDARCVLRYAQSNVFGFQPSESAALEVLLRVAEALLAAARERHPEWRPERTMAVRGITKQMIGFHPERAKFLLHALPHDSEAADAVEAFAHILRWARETPLTPEGHLAALPAARERALAFPTGPANLLAERLHVNRAFPPEQVEAVEQLGRLTNLYIEALSARE